jgi:hypothetical protein
MIRLICFELKLDGFRGLADAVNGPDAVEERQPDEGFSGDYIANGQRGLSGLRSM